MIKVHYDATTGEIKGFYPDFNEYQSIPEPCIEIDNVIHLDCVNNHGMRRVDVATKTIVEYTPPGSTLDELKAAKWDSIKAERDRREREPLPYMGNLLDFDNVSSERLTWAIDAARTAISQGLLFTVNWTCYDNMVLTMSANDIIGVPIAVAQRSDNLHQTARGLREQIEAAATAEELAAIVWPAT